MAEPNPAPVPERKKKSKTRTPDVYELELTSGKKVTVTFSFGKQTIQKAVKIVAGVPLVYLQGNKIEIFGEFDHQDRRRQLTRPQNYRDKDGKVLKVDVEVPACMVRIDGPFGMLQGRSCCKPPDTFSRVVGKRLALAHLFRRDTPKTLTKEDRAEIMRRCVPQTHNWENKKAPAEPPTVPGTPTI